MLKKFRKKRKRLYYPYPKHTTPPILSVCFVTIHIGRRRCRDGGQRLTGPAAGGHRCGGRRAGADAPRAARRGGRRAGAEAARAARRSGRRAAAGGPASPSSRRCSRSASLAQPSPRYSTPRRTEAPRPLPHCPGLPRSPPRPPLRRRSPAARGAATPPSPFPNRAPHKLALASMKLPSRPPHPYAPEHRRRRTPSPPAA